MRFLLVGLLILTTSAAALGQVTGQVISVGYQRHYRPNCWTPMVISLTPESGEDATYEIQVVQQDFDGDVVTYTTPITVTGNKEGQASRDIKKEIYFIPKARRDDGFGFGLPQPNDGNRALNDQLKVWVARRNGQQITRLPIPDTLINIDPHTSPLAAVRGTKLILAVSNPDTGSRPIFGMEPSFDPADGSIDHSDVRGINEDVLVVHLRPRELPESILGYDAVDAVVFCNADPSELSMPTPERREALEEYVRQGGTLVISQPPSWEKTLAFGSLLPVTFPAFGQGETKVQGVVERTKNGQPPLPLYEIMQEGVPWRNPPRVAFGGDQANPQIIEAQRAWAAAETRRIADQWERTRGPFQVAIAREKPGAYVARWIDWNTAEGQTIKTPYIARQSFGLGTVTWVAQDLGDPSLTQPARPNVAIGERLRSVGPVGWPQVWDAVFDWNNRPMVLDRDAELRTQPMAELFDRAQGVDVAFPLTLGMEHGKRGAGLVFLVVFFFVAYWILAGPVSYLVLAGKKRTSMSWFVFALAAGAATLVTAGVVELVLRADPEVRHVSVVRLSPRGPAVVQSGIGLYIADDGGQRIELRESALGHVSYITPFPTHPAQVTDQPKFTTILDYDVPTPSPKTKPDEDPEVVVPFRTTLKKLQAKWVGDYNGSIDGKVQLRDGRLHGVIVNNLPVDLQDVYLCYINDRGQDRLAYLPVLKKGQTLNIDPRGFLFFGDDPGQGKPGSNKFIDSVLELESDPGRAWTGYFHGMFRGAALKYEDSSGARILPVLSFYDRLSPMYKAGGGRTDLLRRGARHMDLSQLVASGDLAITGIANGTPLPVPFYVQGDPVPGSGVTYFQAVLPIDRTVPTTQPTTQEGPE
jgi:hypothetical protein